jgi:hypothetical protein
MLMFATRSKPNQSPKHMLTFANVVEDSLNFNFAKFSSLISKFWRKITVKVR